MIAAGIGFRASATPKSLARAYEMACVAAGVPGADLLASPKSDSAVLIDFAAQFALPLCPADVAGVLTPTPSPRVQAMFGTGSVAEAAALIAAGPNARLLCTRQTSPCGRVTIAIAQSQEPT